jgi:hypothetical protein
MLLSYDLSATSTDLLHSDATLVLQSELGLGWILSKGLISRNFEACLSEQVTHKSNSVIRFPAQDANGDGNLSETSSLWLAIKWGIRGICGLMRNRTVIDLRLYCHPSYRAQ